MPTITRFPTLIAMLLTVAVGVNAAVARTWSVEQDGSGDWVRISTAIEAAASGDTILIGPGRYSDTYEIAPGGVPRLVIAHWSEAKDLVLIGTNRDSVVIGPTSYSESYLPTCFYNGLHVSQSIFRDLTIVNAFSGIFSGGKVEVYGCTIYGSRNCILVDTSDGNIIEQCTFGPGPSGYDFNSQVALFGTGATKLDRCLFLEARLTTSNCSGLVVDRTEFNMGEGLGSRQLAIDWSLSSGEIRDCNIYGMVGLGGDTASVSRCNISTSYADYGLQVGDCAVVVSDCTVLGNRGPAGYDHYGCVKIWGTGAAVSATGSHFLVGDGDYAVWAKYGDAWTPIKTYGFRNNWWGTTDRDSMGLSTQLCKQPLMI